MKKGFAKFMLIPDPKDNRRTIIIRTQYPKFIFELTNDPEPDSKSVIINEVMHFISVRKDLDNYGEPSESYLREVVRWWHYQAEEFETLSAADATNVKPSDKPVNLKAIFDLLNGAFVAQDCFQKDRTWLYQRLNGNIVNGKPAAFNAEQKEVLADYLRVKAQELIEMAKFLEE